jgi:nucleoside-diphosphate-sugar epimerase
MSVSVLVLGGMGFIGRSFVKYLVDFDLATHIRVVDKTLPSMAYLSPAFEAAMSAPRVEYVNGSLQSPESIDRAFAPSDKCPHKFNLVVCLAAETKYGQPAPWYEAKVRNLRIACATKAAAYGVDRYIDVSTGQVYAGASAKPAKETDVVKPWTIIAQYHYEAENAIRAMAGFNAIILRLPVVYGPGDRSGLMPRLVCAAVYRHLRTKMEFLWGEDLRVHTVHVQDVAAGLWHLLCGDATGAVEVYNLVDDGDTTQGSVNAVIEELFRVETGFYGTMTSTFAQYKLEDLVEDANEELTTGWSDLCRATNIQDSPLSPIIDKELLTNHHLALDGSKIKATGFQCSCPKLTTALVRDSIKYWTDLRMLPALAA